MKFTPAESTILFEEEERKILESMENSIDESRLLCPDESSMGLADDSLDETLLRTVIETPKKTKPASDYSELKTSDFLDDTEMNSTCLLQQTQIKDPNDLTLVVEDEEVNYEVHFKAKI